MTEPRVDLATTRFVLPPDARVLEVSELSDRLRSRIGPVEEGYAVVTRPGHRVAAQLVAGPLALLLEEFGEPTRLTDAVLRFARREDRDPMEALDLAFDALALLVDSRVLVPEGSPAASAAAPSLAAGQEFAGFEIHELIRSLDDTELYRARGRDGTALALKIARDARPATAALLTHEAGILDHLAGHDSPQLLGAGSHQDRTFVAMEWCDGAPIGVAAQQFRSAGDRRRLHRLVTRMIEAYARLHSRGVLHVDVHPGNLLVREDGSVVILDFGHARSIGRSQGPLDAGRTGIAHFYDPVMARALLSGRIQPAATTASEQYAVAVLAYLLLTGVHPMEISAVRTELLERIVTRAALPFAARGVAAWPEVERVLSRALAKEPGDRLDDVASLGRAFAAAAPPEARQHRWPAGVKRAHDEAVGLVRHLVMTDEPERVAWFALRTAIHWADPELLAAADVLSRRLGPGWENSLIAAHVARARCDAHTYSKAIAGFIEAGRAAEPAEEGRMMTAAAGLLSGDADHGFERTALVRWAREHTDRWLAPGPPIDSMHALAAQGVLAVVASGAAPAPDGLRASLAAIEEHGGGDVWLWALAHDALGDERFIALASTSISAASPAAEAFALLRLHRLTGEVDEVTHARQRVEAALHCGCRDIDIALLVTELHAPEQADLPPFPFP